MVRSWNYRRAKANRKINQNLWWCRDWIGHPHKLAKTVKDRSNPFHHGNPRRFGKFTLTRQEVRAKLDYEEQIAQPSMEIFDDALDEWRACTSW